MVAGQGETDILDALAHNFPDADRAAVLTAVMVRLRSAADAEPLVVFGWCVEATRDIYRRMIEIGDFAGALRAVKQMKELMRDVPHRPDDGPRTGDAEEDEAGGDGQGP